MVDPITVPMTQVRPYTGKADREGRMNELWKNYGPDREQEHDSPTP